MKKIALHWKIIAGMLLGVVWGLLSVQLNFTSFTVLWIKPFGTIFINLLKLIAMPLVFASLIKGVAGMKDVSRLSKMGFKTLALYMTTTVIAVTTGVIAVNILKPGNSFSEEKKIELKEKYASNVLSSKDKADERKKSEPLKFLIEMVPDNVIDATTDNTKMLQVIFFSLLFGIALISLPFEQVKYVEGFFSGINDIILKIVDFIMLTAPYGVFALLAGLLSEMQDAFELLKALSFYALTVIIGLAIMMFLIYPLLIKILTKGRVQYTAFFKGIMPAQMLAFSTSSSAATLPVTMERCEDHLGISKEVTGFVLPLGATINMDGTSLYQAVATVFIAQAFAIDLTFADQLTIILTATFASIGTAAVPGTGLVMLVIVLGSVGIDPEGIALIFAVDRILDMLRTTVNVTGDAAVATIIANKEGLIHPVEAE